MQDTLQVLELAEAWHQGQTRKGIRCEPFIHHPLRVASLLIENGIFDENIRMAALLHDILEDTLCPPEAVREAAGDQVLAWVLELTDRKDLLKSERKQMQVERAEMLSPEAKLIRLADKIDNVDSLEQDPPASWSYQRRRDYVAWANRVVKQLGNIHPGMQARYRDTQARVWAHLTGDVPPHP
jgi:GTP diphosphokinase / guanosine-3',5'-bis(diphosphate) 3'-diphosphatase